MELTLHAFFFLFPSHLPTNPSGSQKFSQVATRIGYMGRDPATSIMTEQAIETEGVIVAVLAGTMFRVELENKHLVLAHISGKMRKRFIRLTLGDRVRMEMSPYDLGKARITYRLR